MSAFIRRSASIKWLLAELLVIVLGILIAIQVEEWRQYRQDRHDERRVLKSIQRDVDDILGQYSEVKKHFQIAMHASVTLVDAIENGNFGEVEIIQARKDTGMTYLMSNSPTSFEGFLQSGSIGLVQDELLVKDLRVFFGSQRSWILGLNEVHIQRSREVFDLLDVDFKSVPQEDYTSTMSSRTEMLVSVEDFPTSEKLQSELIGLNNFRRSVLEALDEVVAFGQSIDSRIEKRIKSD